MLSKCKGSAVCSVRAAQSCHVTITKGTILHAGSLTNGRPRGEIFVRRSRFDTVFSNISSGCRYERCLYFWREKKHFFVRNFRETGHVVFLRVTPQFYPQNWCEGKKCGLKVRDWKGWIKIIEKQILPSPLPRHYLPFSGIRSTNARHWNTSFLEWASRNSNQSCLPNSIQLQVFLTYYN